MAKAKEAAPAVGPVPHLRIARDESRTEFQQLADASLSPVVKGALSSRLWTQKSMDEIGLNEAVTVIRERAEAANGGDLDAAKAMLVAQAATLDAIFHEMASRAAGLFKVDRADGSWNFNPESMQGVMALAFKAQGQCRATLQTLGELVNPRSVAFIKQANLANGPQQVNNGQTGTPAHAANPATPANKLLEENPSERMDTGAQGAAGRGNQTLEAVGAVNGAAVGRGKVRRFPQRS